jgi:multiple sugar transport system permease protein
MSRSLSSTKPAGYLWRRQLFQAISYTVLAIGGLIMAFPYLWMLSTSLKLPGTWFTLSLIPDPISLQHYQKLLTESLLLRWYTNSIVISAVSTASVAFFSALAGYTFAKYEFLGREIMFIIILTALMIPTEMLIIPWYVSIARIGWIDTLQGVMLPGLVTTFGIFVMRQFMASVPNELSDAGRIDGVSEFGLFWRICLPIARPALAVVVIFTFLSNWNDFLWPLIVVNRNEMLTLQVGLARISALETGPDWGATMSGAAIASVPMLIVFLFFQAQIIRGMTLTGLKG